MDPLRAKDSSTENPHARAPQHWGQALDSARHDLESCGDPQGRRPRLGLLGAEKEEEKEEKEGGGSSAGPPLAGHRAPSPAIAGKGRERRVRSSPGEGRCSAKGRGRHRTPPFPAGRKESGSFTRFNTPGQALLVRGHPFPVLLYPVTALTAWRGTGHPAQEACTEAAQQATKCPSPCRENSYTRTSIPHLLFARLI